MVYTDVSRKKIWLYLRYYVQWKRMENGERKVLVGNGKNGWKVGKVTLKKRL